MVCVPSSAVVNRAEQTTELPAETPSDVRTDSPPAPLVIVSGPRASSAGGLSLEYPLLRYLNVTELMPELKT